LILALRSVAAGASWWDQTGTFGFMSMLFYKNWKYAIALKQQFWQSKKD
jgi:hypothetical protein